MILERIKPAFANDKCIVFAADNSYVPCTSVMIQSILDHVNDKNYYDIIILHKNINQINQKNVLDMNKGYQNVSIRFFDVTSYIRDFIFYTENRKGFAQEAYFRLLIPWVLSDEYVEALYLDGDMITCVDIYEIFNYSPMSGNLISAIRDYWGICNCYIPGDGVRKYRETIGLDNIDEYIISCTIIFNLNEFRRIYELEKILELAASREWRQHDQDIINILCKNRITHINPKWGLMSDYGNNHYLPEELYKEVLEAENNPYVIHFGGDRKPWLKSYVDYDLEFWRYAHVTAYFKWLLEKVKSYEYRNYVAYNLSNGNIETVLSEKGIERYYRNVYLGNLASGHTRYRNIQIKNNILHLEGMVGFFGARLDSDINVYITVNQEEIPVTMQWKEDGFNKKKNVVTYRGEAFSFDYMLASNVVEYKIGIVCYFNGIKVEKNNLGFDKFSPLGREFENCYIGYDGWLAKTDKRYVYIIKSDKKTIRQCEKTFLNELWKSGTKSNRKAVIVRQVANLIRLFVKKPIWLISDRVSKADDNGEAFFRYLNKDKKKEILSFYIIKKDTTDYKRLKQYGKVIPTYSYRHKILHLLTSISISSQTDEVYRNPFQDRYPAYRDMLSKVDFVFLQHGIISNDLSDWLCKKNQYIAGFVTSTNNEFKYVLDGNYHYSEKEIWLTGLPRFDYLENHNEKIITIIPTWRKYLATNQNLETGIWNLKSNFSESRYVKFYRELLHNSLLREAAQKYGYTIQFKIHPSFLYHEKDFKFDTDVNIVEDSITYKELYAKSSLLVTDYSSAIYDFIYLRKPIIYAQFDAEDFFAGSHMCGEGYFDYETDGFGEVEYTVESTVDRIIEYMETDCQLKDKYRERIDNFFAYNDRNNCQRVYEKIMELQNQK